MCWASSEILAFPAFRVLAIDSREEVLVSGPLDIYSHVYELILVFGKKNILKEYSINSPEFITDCGYTR
jgi:hypothetical protein